MKTSRALLTGLLFAALASPASAESNGNIYVGLGANVLALDNGRVFDVPTSSPGHAPKTLNGIVGYQFNELWATDLTFGGDVSGEVSANQFALNGYRFFGSKNWKPYVSAGLSTLGVDEATDDRTQQIQTGLGVSGMFTDSLEFRANYQFFSAISGESNFDRAFGLSLNWHIGGKTTSIAAAPMPTPEPAPMQKDAVETAVRPVVVNRQWIGDATASKRPALLIPEVRDILRFAQSQVVFAAVQETRFEQACNIFGIDRAVGDSIITNLHFDKRFEPTHSSRAVAHYFNTAVVLAGVVANGIDDFISAHRKRRGLARHKQSRGFRRSHFAPAFSSNESKRSASTRPWTRPSIITAGEHAQLPRQ